MWVLRRGSAILVAGAGNGEAARCDGGDISWQAQYFVRVRRVDAERFVAGAGNCEVVSCGRGAQWDWRVNGCCWGWTRETAWQGCVMCVCSDNCFCLTFGGSLVRHARFADFDM